MGSLDSALITGFLCRLCSKMHREVIHIYGVEGLLHELEKKINNYLPVTVSETDPLPKTICENCMSRVEAHHDLMTQIRKNNLIFTKFRTAAEARRVRMIRTRRNEIITANRSQNPNSTDAATSSVTTNHVDSDEEDERTLASIVRGRSRSPSSRVAGTSTHENSEEEEVNREANRLIANLFSRDEVAYDSPPSPEYNFSIEESDSDNEDDEDDSDNEDIEDIVVRSPSFSDNSENHVDTEEAESE